MRTLPSPLRRGAVVTIAVLGACAQDFDLSPRVEDPGGPTLGGDDPRDPGDPNDPNSGGSQSPWGDFDPGAIPPLYLAFALGEPGYWGDCWLADGEVGGCCCDACDCDVGTDEVPSGSYWGGSAAYVVTDLRGHVVEERPIPDAAPGAAVSHLGLSPAGPGRFLAVTWVEGLHDADGPAAGENDDSDGVFDNPDPLRQWVAWVGDAAAHSSTPVVRGVDGWYTGEAEVVGTGRRVPVRSSYDAVLAAAISPAFPDDALIWSGASYCQADPNLRAPDPLHDVSLVDPTLEPTALDLGGLAPRELRTTGHQRTPLALQVGVDEQGAETLFVGLAVSDCATWALPTTWYGVRAADGSLAWGYVVPAGVTASAPVYTGLDGGAALYLETGTDPTAPPVLVQVHRGIRTEHTLPAGRAGWRLATHLHPDGPSYLAFSRDPVTGADALHVVVGDRVVHTIDELRYGLERRTFRALSAVVVPEP